MDTEKMLYDEIVALRKEMKEFKDSFFSLKLKVYVMCALIGTSSGGVVAKLLQ